MHEKAIEKTKWQAIDRENEMQGQWQHESPAKEYVEQVKCCEGTDCTPRMMKQAFFALKGGDWEEYKSIFRVQAKATEWAFDRIQEAFEKVAKDEARKLSTVQKYVKKYRLFSSRQQKGKEVSRCHTCARLATAGTLHLVGLREEEELGGVRYVERNTIGSNGTGFWSYRQVIVFIRPKVFEAHAVPQGWCGNLINALKLLANQQEDGDGPKQSIVTDFCERSRTGLTGGLGNISHLREGSRSFEVRRPKCEEGSPEVFVRECPKELTLRAEEVMTQKSCINVDHIAQERWGPPLVDADCDLQKVLNEKTGKNCTIATKK